MAEVITAPKSGLFDRFFKKKPPSEEVMADRARYQEQERQQDEISARLRATPPRELLEEALKRAGLPNDLSQVIGRGCVYTIPMGSFGHSVCARIEGVELQYWRHLRMWVSRGLAGASCELWWEEDRWWTWAGSAATRGKHPIRNFSLL